MPRPKDLGGFGDEDPRCTAEANGGPGCWRAAVNGFVRRLPPDS